MIAVCTRILRPKLSRTLYVCQIRKLDEEEVFESFNKSDVNQDSGVTWDEFLKVTYHTDKEKLANLELLYPNESAELIKVRPPGPLFPWPSFPIECTNAPILLIQTYLCQLDHVF